MKTITFIPVLLAVGGIVHATPAPTPIVPRAPNTFVHPGVSLNKAQLDAMRSRVNAGQQPWKDAYNAMMGSQYGSTTRNPAPRATVECGSGSNPNNGCTDERQDAIAAYTMSLAWYVTQDSKYAKKAIAYMNAWSGTIAHTNSNAPLQTGWSAASWVKAAEIIKHTYTGWASADIMKFENMLRNVYLPGLLVGSNFNGNWELVMMQGAIGAGVFLDDKSVYDQAMKKFMGRVPAYIYLTKDGKTPKAAPGDSRTGASLIKYWQGQDTFPENGIAQETCRDFGHTGLGIASIANVAETSRIQGVDLWDTSVSDVGTRVRYALGFHAQFQRGTSQPSWLCPGKSLSLGLGPVTEIGFNALHTRDGYSMTNTEALTLASRPEGTNALFVAWETLTHAGAP